MSITPSFVSKIREAATNATPEEAKLDYPHWFILDQNSDGNMEISSIDHASAAERLRKETEDMEILFSSAWPKSTAYVDEENDRIIIHMPNYTAAQELLTGLGLQGYLSVTCNRGGFVALYIPGLDIIDNIPKE